MMTRPCDMLPPVRGSLTHGAPLKDLVWFRAGGPAEVLFRPADRDDLADFLAAKPADLRVSVIGVGSNLLVRDGGIPGAVVHWTEPWRVPLPTPASQAWNSCAACRAPSGAR
jgi:UDP-N-acetylmuramate dehydrogenase